jgi:acyl carrier protein
MASTKSHIINALNVVTFNEENEEVDATTSLKHLGMNSLLLVEFCNLLARESKIEIDRTKISLQLTVDDLVQLIENEMN